MKLELGCGANPTDGYVHHDRWRHSPHVDLAFDLESMPWPVDDDSVDELLALDVFEHLRPWICRVQDWMEQCWRILKPGGLLEMRLPAYDNHYSYADPTHYRVFHEESFHYFCPQSHGTAFKNFGSYYWGAGYAKWWEFESATREGGEGKGDIRYKLRKCATS